MKDPGTGEKKKVRDMSWRALDRALDAMQGKKPGQRTIQSMTKRLKAMTNELNDIATHGDKLPRQVVSAFIKAATKFLGGGFIIETQGGNGALKAKTREELAAIVRKKIQELQQLAGMMRKLDGKLSGTSKGGVLDDHEIFRTIVVGWPSWAKRNLKRKV